MLRTKLTGPPIGLIGEERAAPKKDHVVGKLAPGARTRRKQMIMNQGMRATRVVTPKQRMIQGRNPRRARKSCFANAVGSTSYRLLRDFFASTLGTNWMRCPGSTRMVVRPKKMLNT